MSTELRLRRGTTAQHATFTGALGEVTIDTDKKVPVVHDGITVGGNPLISASTVDVLLEQLASEQSDALARLARIGTIGKSDYNKVKNIGLWTPTIRVNNVYADIPLTSVNGCVWTYSEAATLIQGSFTLNNPTSDTDYGSLKMLGFPGATFDTGYGTYASPVGYGLITNDGVTQPILLRFFNDYIIFDGASSSVVIAKGKTASFKFQAQIQHAHWGDI
jgi:hypothetical protein